MNAKFELNNGRQGAGKKRGLTTVSGMVLAATMAAGQLGAAQAQEAEGVDEIVVTAQKREQSLQDVPVAVTALQGEELTNAGISQATDLSRLVPGLAVGQGGPSTQVYLRGVGNYATNGFADPAISFNMDGVYIARFSGISGNFFDVSRVEVLKGPQGTLYGRNATGGALNIVTNKPALDGFAAGIGVEGGNYNLRRFDGYINLPLGDHAALRIAARDTSRDGYQTDGNDDDDSNGIRAQLLFEPDNATSLLFSASRIELGGKGPAQVPVTNAGFVNNSDPWTGQSQTLVWTLPGPGQGLLATAPPAPPALFQGVDRSTGSLGVVAESYGVQFERDFGGVTLNVLANYLTNENDSKSFGPGFLFDVRTSSEQSSLEARLSGAAGALDWVVGAYVSNEELSENFWVDQGFLFNQTGVDMDSLTTDAQAVFGQATFSFTEQLRLTGGLRFSTEEKSAQGTTFTRQPQAFTCAASGTTQVFLGAITPSIPQAATNGDGIAYPFPFCRDVISGQRDWDDTSWRVALDYDLSPDSLLYVSASRGFKAGGFFAAGNASLTGNTVEPETLVAFAIGSKNRFFDGRLQLNAEAFAWDYKDHQESYLAPTSASGTFNFVTQRADAEIFGLDVELNALLTDDDEIGLRVQYLNAEYTDAPFIVASPGPGNPSPLTACTATQDIATPSIWRTNCAGQQMPRSPDFSGVLDYNHTFELPSGSIVAGAHARYSAGYWSAVDYNPLQKQDAFTMLGAALSYHSENDGWSITAFGENLTEEVVYANSFMYPSKNSVIAAGAGNIAMVQLEAPRTYGVRLRADF
jgi:iron complex outermembrane recepter protein